MKNAVLAATLSVVTITLASAEDDSNLVKMRFDRGRLSIAISANDIDFSGNNPPKDHINGKSFLPRRCVLEGEASMSIAHDIVIRADRLSFRSDGTEGIPTSIKAVGNCKWTDSEYEISADRFELVGGLEGRLVFSGNAVLVHGGEDANTRLSAESFTVRDGKIMGSGSVIFEPIAP